MKPFWFAFNVTDWLSSKSVRMMSLAERGAYIGLLATAWGEDVPGTLPANEDTVRRLAEMSPDDWKVSGPALLEQFPLSACGTYRYNPRLVEERGKREELSEKKAEAGRRSAAKRAAGSGGSPTGGQQKPNTIPTPVAQNPTPVENSSTEGQLDTITITSTTDVVQAGEPAATDQPPLKANPGGKGGGLRLPLPSEDVVLFDPATWPGLREPERFAKICADLHFPQIHMEKYRKQILVSLEGKQMPAHSLRNWIKTYLNNEEKVGPLALAPVAKPAPAAMPADPSTLWGELNPNYDHRRGYDQPAGTYTGDIK